MSVLGITVVLILIFIIIFGTGYIFFNHFKNLKPIPPIDDPLTNTTLSFQVYSLLSCFANNTYEAQLLINSQLYTLTAVNNAIKDIPVYSGMPVSYSMVDVSSQKPIFTVEGSITTDDIDNATTIYLCDGAIVGNQNIFPLQYSISTLWGSNPSLCQNINILYSLQMNNVGTNCETSPISLQTLTCDEVNNSNGVAVNFDNNLHGWLGMNFIVTNGNTQIGSATFANPQMPVLIITPTTVAFSSS